MSADQVRQVRHSPENQRTIIFSGDYVFVFLDYDRRCAGKAHSRKAPLVERSLSGLICVLQPIETIPPRRSWVAGTGRHWPMI